MSEARKLRVWWYRVFHGLNATQAEFRVDRDLARAASAPAGASARAPDRRFHCVCGQLLAGDETHCHTCLRRQYLPFWLRSLGRDARGLLPSDHPAAHGVILLILLGYTIQMITGGGGVFNPTDTLGTLELGAAVPSLTVGPQPWRAVTYAFLHGGGFHLLMNMVTLVQIAPLIEGYFGSARFLLAWVLTGAAGVVLPPLIFGVGHGITVGASGSICGLIGMAWIAARSLQTPQAREVKRLMQRWMLYTAVLGVMFEFGGGPNVAHGAHIGGAVAGITLGWLLPPPLSAPRRRLTPFIGLVALLLLGVALWAMVDWRQGGMEIPQTRDEFSLAWRAWRYQKTHGAF